MAVWECGNGDCGDDTPSLTLLHLNPHMLQQLVVERVRHVKLDNYSEQDNNTNDITVTSHVSFSWPRPFINLNEQSDQESRPRPHVAMVTIAGK